MARDDTVEILLSGSEGCRWGWYVWAAGNLPFPLSSAIRCIRDMHARLAEPLLVVEWESSTPEVDSWMVEWLPETAESEFSALSWESVSHVTNWTIEQGSWHRPCRLP